MGVLDTPAVPLSRQARLLKYPDSVVILGDSITNRIALNNTSTLKSHDARGYWTWASAFLGGRLVLLNNAGVDSDRTDQMLTRIQTDVLDYAPGWCVVQAGVNDVSQSVSAATTITNLTSIYTRLLANGIKVIATTITPNNSSSAAKKLVRGQVNEWMRSYAAFTPGVVLCDWAATVTATNAENWLGVGTVLSPDGVHPNALGAARMGRKLADTLAPLLPLSTGLGVGISNVDPTNAVQNGFFDASTIASWAFGGTSTNTQVARTDLIPGNWEQMVTASAVNCYARYIQSTPATYFTAGTDKIYAVAELQSDAWTSATDLHLRLICANVSAVTIMESRDLWNSSGDTYPLESQPGLAETVVLRTPAVTVPALTTSMYVQCDFTGQGTVRWSRVGIRKLASPLTALA